MSRIFAPSRARNFARRNFGTALAGVVLGVAPFSVLHAQQDTLTKGQKPADTTRVLRGVTIIGTRTDLDETRRRVRQVPGGVTLIEPAEIRSTRQANLKDVLGFVPGVFIQPRSGAADESQISIRGSGLRNNFHGRGVNILINGMPYRNADGFTDFESLELLTTEAISVYKGANALRFGGSTLGGAINLETKTGYTAPRLGAFVQGGSFGFGKAQLESGQQFGNFNYYASYAHTMLDGYRAWSDQRRDRVNVHAGYRFSPRIDARAFYLFAKVEEHLPSSVAQSTLDDTPRQADSAAFAERWGRNYNLQHVGVQLRAQLSPHQRLEVSPYVQNRNMDHPIFQVLVQQSRDIGAEIRYENTAPLGKYANRLTIGVQPAYQTMHSQRYLNVAGEHGALAQDEQSRATNFATYLENAFSVTPRLTATLGARFDQTARKVDDNFLSDGDQSDTRRYTPVTPRAGLLYDMANGTQLFANASKTVEPPLFLELRSFTATGGFNNLDAQHAWQYEIGARGRRLGFGWELSLYDVELQNEILNINVQPFPSAPFTIPSYRNTPKSRHTGAEMGVNYLVPTAIFARGPLSDHLNFRAAYTIARYTYVEDSTYRGHDIPGAPRHHVTAEMRYDHPSGFVLAPQVEWVPQAYYVNSANTAKNTAWATLGLRAEWTIQRVGATVFAEGRNLTDRRYSASVQVDSDAGKFFEPADGRSVYAGFRWTH